LVGWFINIAIIIHRSLRFILTCTSLSWDHAAGCRTRKLQTLQHKVLRILTELPRVKPVATLHEQTGMPLVNNYIKGLASKLYLKSAGSSNCQIEDQGQYDPGSDKYLRPLSVLTRQPYASAIVNTEYINSYLVNAQEGTKILGCRGLMLGK
jgi:hypothetical protein